jgi:uncharacterized delta-60 repeat protein
VLLPAGSLDPGFGQGGSVVTQVAANTGSVILAMATQKDGKIVAVGYASISSQTIWTVTRYTASGALDPTFGNDGIVLTQIDAAPGKTNSTDKAEAVAIQPDGKIVVGGTAVYQFLSRIGAAVVRYNSNGSLDTTFGTGGISYSLIYDQAGVSSLSLWRGKIVTADQDYDATTFRSGFMISELNTDGSLNTAFASKGFLRVSLGTSQGQVGGFSAMALEANGTIVIAAANAGAQNNVFVQPVLATVSPQGKLTKLVQVQTVGGSRVQSVYFSLAIGAKGKIVVAGQINGPPYQGFVQRYNANLSLDRRFGTGGTVMATILGTPAIASNVAVQRDGKIIVQGGIPAPGYWRGPFGIVNPAAKYFDTFNVLRLGQAGKPDRSFVNAGWAEVPMGPSYANPWLNGIVLQQNQHRIVVGGTASGNYSMVGLLGKAKRVLSPS